MIIGMDYTIQSELMWIDKYNLKVTDNINTLRLTNNGSNVI